MKRIPTPRRISRTQAIQALRQELLRCVDDQNSLCQVAGRQGFFCGGFAHLTPAELARCFPDLPPSAHADPAEFQRWLDARLLALQDVARGRLPCDVEHGHRIFPCAGWDEFYEGELARFYRELCGENVEVVPDGVLEAVVC